MEGFLGEIRVFAGDYAPQGWALCDGSQLGIAGNEALFTLLGTTYGGDGVANFALPDLRGRVAIGQGQGAGRSFRALGQSLGAEAVVLGQGNLPVHTHAVSTGGSATTVSPHGGLPGAAAFNLYAPAAEVPASLAGTAASSAGESMSHDNMMPGVGINFIINLAGIYPTTN